ncbi:MAG: DUF2799 domain-containing protein [Pseudomonadota bacterium]
MLRCAVTAFGILVACGVAGCAGLQQTDHSAACTAQSWERFGENDGRLGISTQDRIELFETCNNQGIPADIAAYEAGKARGIEVYCTLENGLEVGQTGRPYDGVCSGQQELDFLQGYNVGFAQYEANRPATVIYPGINVGLGFGFGSYGFYGGYPRYRYYNDGYRYKKKHHKHHTHGKHRKYGHDGHKPKSRKSYFHPNEKYPGLPKKQMSQR